MRSMCGAFIFGVACAFAEGAPLRVERNDSIPSAQCFLRLVGYIAAKLTLANRNKLR